MKRYILAPDAPDSAGTLAAALLEGGLPAEAKIIYDARNRLASFDAGDGNVYNIKAFRLPHIVNRMAYGWLRGSKARRAFNNACRLRSLGVPTPQPFAYIEEYDRLHWLHKSYFVSRQLSEDFKEIRFVEKNEDFENIIRDVALFIADFHRKGVWMIDLTPGNIMMRRNGEHYEFALVDVNRMKFNVKDCDTLVASCGRLFEHASTRRLFAHHYAEAMKLPEDYVLRLMEKQVTADILRRKRKKALFHPKQFFNPG